MCLHPIHAHHDKDGGRITFNFEGDLRLPCGTCIECITLRATEWAIRAKHEISCHPQNCFLTLTYDDIHLPSHLLVKDPFQRFMKRLRERTKKKILYMVSHEYGSKFFRPHHHCILFGHDFDDLEFLRKTKTGHNLFTSPTLASLWTEGYHSIGTANEKTAYYIAAYAIKGKKHEICLPTGEFTTVSDTFDVSKRPGIGYNFLLQNYKQLVDSGERLPRYYTKKLEIIDEDYLQKYEDKKNFRVRSASELHAKHVISQSQSQLMNTEFRHAPDKTREFILRKNHLASNIIKE